MTYCVGMLLDTGLVFLSDSRTSAGVDHISTFRKTTVLQKPGERVLVLQTAGNLAIKQAVTSMLERAVRSVEMETVGIKPRHLPSAKKEQRNQNGS
jgi:putative proteasome-type protease